MKSSHMKVFIAYCDYFNSFPMVFSYTSSLEIQEFHREVESCDFLK